jgi:hypothetical protein
MSKALAQFLDKPETLISAAIAKLELLSALPSLDVRLLAEINTKLRSCTADLGLDADDTTSRELYYSARERFAQDMQKFSGELHLGKNTNSDEIARVVVNFFEESRVAPEVHALKRSVAKDILRSHPPRKLMKKLNYRSIDSMLKLENIAQLYAALPVVESERWLNVFWRDLAHVNPSDFETRKIELVIMPAKRWGSVAQDNSTESIPQIGAVVVWSTKTTRKIGAFGLSLQIAKSISDLKVSSGFIKLSQVQSDFGKTFVSAITDGLGHPAKLSSTPISWKSIFRHYGSYSKEEYMDHMEQFGPHMLHEDLQVGHSLKSLADKSLVFKSWLGLEHVAQNIESKIVSLNPMDLLADHANDSGFDNRSRTHFEQSLWHELIDRYMKHAGVRTFVTNQLVPQEIPVEDINIPTNTDASVRPNQRVGVF